MIALSAVVAAWQAIDRLFHPRTLDHLGCENAHIVGNSAGGYIGQNLAMSRAERVKSLILFGSAALIADGVHARADGFTSLAVVVGALGVMLGFPIADPIVGLLISVAIIVLLWGTVRSIGQRLMDGVDPALIDRAEAALGASPGVVAVRDVRLRWVGHRVHGAATIVVSNTSVADAQDVADQAERSLARAVPHLGDAAIRTVVG